MIREYEYHIKKNETIKHFLYKQGYNKDLLSYIKKKPNQLLVNDNPSRIIDSVNKNDVLKVIFVDEKSNACPKKHQFEILYEDDDIVAVNKPANMPTHTGFSHFKDTLQNALIYHYEKQKIPFVFRCINRLDTDTTGIVLVAKNKFAAYKFNNIKINKKYYCLCVGKTKPFGFINKPIYKNNDEFKRIIDPKGKPSLTLYKTEKYYKDKDISLLSVKLITGRTHQIRLHFASINHPLVGDSLYGKESELINRQALCCYYTSFIHPFTKKKVVIKADMPLDMSKII